LTFHLVAELTVAVDNLYTKVAFSKLSVLELHARNAAAGQR